MKAHTLVLCTIKTAEKTSPKSVKNSECSSNNAAELTTSNQSL